MKYKAQCIRLGKYARLQPASLHRDSRVIGGEILVHACTLIIKGALSETWSLEEIRLLIYLNSKDRMA